MNRRAFIAALGGAAAGWPLTARAQQTAMPLLGVLNAGSAASVAQENEVFRSHLRQLGYVEGRNIRFEYRFADGILDRLPRLAEELVQLKPSVILSARVPANIAVHKATRTIPIVMASGADPVAFGLVESMSRPGGNVTGLTNFAEQLASKQLDVMRELLPNLARVATLVNVENPLHEPQWRETKDAAARAAIALVSFEFHKADELESAFALFVHARAEAVLVPPDVTFSAHRRKIVELAATARLPAVYYNRSWVEDGGLINYGPNQVENYYRAAIYVDKILKGAQPAELPIERPTKIELVINLKTAKALGLTIPPSLLARADEVIE
jgi:putative ABC transport system substrate-binding protein